jgi:hypothetical protein
LPKLPAGHCFIATLVTYKWYRGVAGDGLRSVGEAYLPLTKSGCSILPVARHLRAGIQLPGPRFLKATAASVNMTEIR